MCENFIAAIKYDNMHLGSNHILKKVKKQGLQLIKALLSVQNASKKNNHNINAKKMEHYLGLKKFIPDYEIYS